MGDTTSVGPVDELAVLGLECFGHHGVFEHERREGQVFVIGGGPQPGLTVSSANETLRVAP